jgi:hypothetical protein
VTPARAGLFVGVDVVDLADPRCQGKHEDERFIGRILGGAERDRLERSEDRATVLWRLWAAKEAAFKVATKVRGAAPPFVHAAFRVEPVDATPGFGFVEWEDQRIRVHWHQEPGRVGVVGWNGIADPEAIEWGWGPDAALDPEPGSALEPLLERLTERERRPVHSRGSALVRLAARAAAAVALAVEESRVEVVSGEGPKGRTPPHVLLDGEVAPLDVSLSHHGRWLAWAIRRATPLLPEPA